ncbi:DUF1102 domain-containing protein [Halopiger xanaduensis]|uniref:DUF1102 domain-containing protein n=1 Tax=Halopiger xanaduensis (strain DSM 18323 / JCM 14033 / SH-6) TaxID=797210 RepID=F8DA89_HALXS|nr:DUF1102 domain-containing protein [Halopiger xanaduensis]AEH38161.1 hypothetical protein Halxa_3550 [Halopiger xanaduensis SH-6]
MTSAAASRWIVLVLLTIGVVGTGVVATDAGLLSAEDDPEMRDQLHGHDDLGNETGIVAEPHDGPNGAYAYLDGDGELVIDLTVDNDALEKDGVSAGAVTGIDDVVTLRNEGNESATVWLEHDAESVTFRTDGGDSIEGANEAAVLEPAESVHVGFVVDARDLEAGEAVIESLRFHTRGLENDDGGDSSSGTDSNGGADSSTSSPSPAVEVVEPDSKTRTVTVSDVREQTVPIDLGSLRVGKSVVLEGVTIQFGDAEDATFDVRADRSREKGDERAQPHPRPADASTIGAVAVEDAPPAAAIESVEYRFTVDRDRFAEHASSSSDNGSALGFYLPRDGTSERRALEAADETETGDSDGTEEDDEPTDTDRYTATVTVDSLSSGIVGVPNAPDASPEDDPDSSADSDGSADDSAATDADGSDADSQSADSSGNPALVAVVGMLALIASLRKRARG